MGINIGKETIQVENKKVSTLSMQELTALSKINLRQISALEKDSKLYNLKQMKRDEDLFSAELELDEKFKRLHNETISVNDDLRDIKQLFLVLAKNFKNLVSKDELSTIKDKVNSFKFEELATNDDLNRLNEKFI